MLGRRVVLVVALVFLAWLAGATIVRSTPRGSVAAMTVSETSPYRVVLPLVRNADDGIDPMLVAGRTDPFGVRVDALPTNAGLADAATLRARWTRISFAWSTVEPTMTTPATYRWDVYDRVFQTAAENGLTVIATIDSNPAWAARKSCGPLEPGMTARLAAFVEAAARRYAQPPYRVRYWEFFNEPDLAEPNDPPPPGEQTYGELIGGCWGLYPAEYAAALRTVYDAVKAGNPQAVVIFGGLAFDWFNDDGRAPDGQPYLWGTCVGGHFNRQFVDGVLQAERSLGRRIFDVMNFHYFRFYDGCWRDDRYGPGVIGKATVLRDRLALAGVFDRPLIVTEYGHYAGYDSSDDRQADSVAQMMAEAMAADLRVVIWYTLYDDADYHRWGLVRGDGSRRPAFTAFQFAERLLGTARYVGPVRDVLGASGYRFRRLDGTCVDVVWSATGAPVTTAYQTSALTVFSKLGEVVVQRTGDAGQPPGLVTFSLDVHPVFALRASCP